MVSMQYNTPAFISLFIICCSIFSVVVCTAQLWSDNDIKRIVALSSVVHMSGAILLLTISDTMSGSLVVVSIVTLLLSHSLLSCLLFTTVGMISGRYHTRDIF